MKRCPQCSTTYADDSLTFCLQDGQRLAAIDDTGSPTVVMPEEVTRVAAGRDRSAATFDDPAGRTVAVEQKRSNTGKVIAITAGVMILLFLLAVGVVLLILRANIKPPANQASVTNSSSNNAAAGNTVSPTPAVSPTPKASPSATASPTPRDFDPAAERKSVADRLEMWAEDSSSGTLDDVMGNYAPKVDYYTKPGLASAAIKADKSRAFERYNKMDVDISNVQVTIDPGGTTASATFDKEWHFDGDQDSSEGKVQQFMKLQLINDNWLIVAEKDLKVYYKR